MVGSDPSLGAGRLLLEEASLSPNFLLFFCGLLYLPFAICSPPLLLGILSSLIGQGSLKLLIAYLYQLKQEKVKRNDFSLIQNKPKD